MAEPVEAEVYSAHDSLEGCRRDMELREREYLEESRKLGAAALAAKKAGNFSVARARILERRRVVKRIEKLRHGLLLVDSQLEAIRTSELDRQIMLTLRASTSAMKKAGIGVQLEDAENIMTELDNTIKDTQDLTTVLSAPLAYAEEDQELDAELEWLEETPLLDHGLAFVAEHSRAPRAPDRAQQEQEQAPTAPQPHEQQDEELEAVV